MTADEPFRLMIWERPDDNGPRLVYADWLEEQGECDRAELIRLQCLGGDAAREQELLTRHGESWAGPAAQHSYAIAYRRGFVEEITLDITDLFRHGDAIFVAAPIRLLRLIGAGRNIDAFLSSPHLAGLAALHLTDASLGDAGVTALAACEHLQNLRTLRLGRNSIGDDGVEALADSPWLSRLETLVMFGNLFGDAGATALATSRALTGLRHLDLSYNSIGEAGAEALAHAPGLPKLERLDLSRGDDGFSNRAGPIRPKVRAALAARYGAQACKF
jgi:uncharacterized protein (TIGR02996 family)